jgi:hypothetical protein
LRKTIHLFNIYLLSIFFVLSLISSAIAKNDVAKATFAGSDSEQAEKITIRVYEKQIINDSFYGFGVETLPWLWTKENREAGVGEDDIQLNLKRIREMNLPITRIFVPWETWNPSVDYQTFTWDSDEMISLYNTLDIYQETGTSVIIVTVDWLRNSPWEDVVGSSQAVLKLLEHLVLERGYNCIRFWTLTNEPELTYGWLRKIPFENYIKIHQLVKKGLEKRNLPVKIIASDEMETQQWFERTVESLQGTADIFSSHIYPYPQGKNKISDFLNNRLGIIKKASSSKNKIPFFLCEFGFRGSVFGACTNTFINDYEYGLYVADLCIEVLNSGVDAALLWCLHQIRLIDEISPEGGRMMRIGLWGYKDEDWRSFPVFYLYQLFTKYINANSRVLKTEVLPSNILKAACVKHNGKFSIFIVNLTDTPQAFLFKGISAGSDFKKYLYTRSILPFIRDNPLVFESRVSFDTSLEDEIPPMSVILYTNLER